MKSDKARKYFEKVGPKDVSSWWDPESSDRSHLYVWEIQIVKAWLGRLNNRPENLKFLELACGKGRVRLALDGILPKKTDYSILDINPKMLKIAKLRLKSRGIKVKSFLGKAEYLPFMSNNFDVVICLDSFVHFPNLDKVLVEVHRVLKPGGLLVSNVDLSTSVRRRVKSAFYTLNTLINKDYKYQGEGIFRPFTSREFVSIQLRHGLKIIKSKFYSLFAPIDVEIVSKETRIYLLPKSLSNFLLPLDKKMSKLGLLSCLNTYLITLSIKEK